MFYKLRDMEYIVNLKLGGQAYKPHVCSSKPLFAYALRVASAMAEKLSYGSWRLIPLLGTIY